MKLKYGDKIRFVRTKVRDITLNDLAKMSGLSVSYLSDAELGRSNMSIKALEKVADALGVSSSFLLNNEKVSLKDLVSLNKSELPQDIVEFLSRPESLAYAVLARDLATESIDPEFLRDLLQSIKKMKSKKY